MNVTNDTNLLPPGSPVRSMKSSGGMIVPPKKEYTNYWGSKFDIEPKPTEKVNRYTRAGYGGRNIFCPKCDKRARVYHFSWSALQCQHCKSMIDKYDWKLR